MSDISDIIRHNLLDARGIDLVLLAKSSFYLRDFKHSKDIYGEVHARAMSLFRLKELDPDTIRLLTKIYEEQQIFTDSPFVTSRIQR